MIDTVKLFFASLHVLPGWLRQAFGLMFLTTMIVLAFTFKKWLEARRTTKDVDLWTCVPITPALVAACFWGVWASAAVYHVYLDDVKTAQAKAAGKAVTTAAQNTSIQPLAASAKSLRSATKSPARAALPEPDAARAPRAEVGGAVITPRSARPAKTGKTEVAEAPVSTEAAPEAEPQIAPDSTAPVAPAVVSKADDDNEVAPPAPTQGKLAKRLKKGRPHATPPVEQAAAAPAAPAEAPAEAPVAPVTPKGDEGPRFKVERPTDAPAAPASAAP